MDDKNESFVVNEYTKLFDWMDKNTNFNIIQEDTISWLIDTIGEYGTNPIRVAITMFLALYKKQGTVLLFPSPCFCIDEVLVSPLTFAGVGKTVAK